MPAVTSAPAAGVVSTNTYVLTHPDSAIYVAIGYLLGFVIAGLWALYNWLKERCAE